MNILDYVKLYRPKMVDIWRVSVEAYPESIGPFIRAMYDYDVVEDRFIDVDVPAEFKLPDPVRASIVARPQRGSLHHDWWMYNWRSEPLVGRREHDDIEFSAYELSSIERIHVQISVEAPNGDEWKAVIILANDGSILSDPTQHYDRLIRNIGRRLDSVFRNQNARRGFMIVDGYAINWQVTKVDWAQV